MSHPPSFARLGKSERAALAQLLMRGSWSTGHGTGLRGVSHTTAVMERLAAKGRAGKAERLGADGRKVVTYYPIDARSA